MVLDPGLGRQMEAIFLDDLTPTLEIDAAAFSARPWFERTSEWVASLLTRIL